MEVQDLPAIAEVAHARNALVVLDNTWSAGVLFDAFAHGVDVTMQAITKYVGGHSDLLLGSITVRDPELYRRLGDARQVSALPSRPTTAASRCAAFRRSPSGSPRSNSALEIARWPSDARRSSASSIRPCPRVPATSIWARDFPGSSGVFSIVFAAGTTREAVRGLRRCADGSLRSATVGAGREPGRRLPSERPPRGRPTITAWCVSASAWRSPADLIADLETSLKEKTIPRV